MYVVEPGESTIPVRWEFLDAARGIASLAVVIQHVIWFTASWAPDVFSIFWSPGRFGVVLFFFVSGYIVPHSLERRGNIKSFWVGRFWRLMPLYYFCFAVVSILILSGADLHLAYDPRSIKHVLINLTMMQDLVKMPSISAVTWTLGVEVLLYIAITIAFAMGFLKNTRLITSVLLVLFFIAAVIAPIVFHFRFPAGSIAVFTSLLSGMLLYRWKEGKIETKECALWIVACFAVLVSAAIMNYGNTRASATDIQPTRFCAIFSALTGYLGFVLILRTREMKYPKPLLSLGQWSYSIYLLHPLALSALNFDIPNLAKAPLQILGSIVFGYLGYTFIEKPGLALGKKLAARA